MLNLLADMLENLGTFFLRVSVRWAIKDACRGNFDLARQILKDEEKGPILPENLREKLKESISRPTRPTFRF
jgi:hypothetical protein